ncbi:MAG TPA: hypothetical protein VF817_00265 [Patescibacteria group bacterium]
MEKYSYEKAYSESEEIRKKALEAKQNRGETGEPTAFDYSDAENKSTSPEHKDDLTQFAELMKTQLNELEHKYQNDISLDRISSLASEIIEIKEIIKSPGYINEDNSPNIELLTKIDNLFSSIGSLNNTLTEIKQDVSIILKEFDSEKHTSDLDKKIKQSLHDRLLNDSSGPQLYIYNLSETRKFLEQLSKIEDFSNPQSRLSFKRLTSGVNFCANFLYGASSFFFNFKKMLNSFNQVVKKNNGDFAYGKDSLRLSEFQISYKNANSLEYQELEAQQEEWEKIFNKLADKQIIDYKELIKK